MQTTWQRLLERLASGDPVVGFDDVRRWSKPDFESAVRLGIVREADSTATVMCDNCDEGHSSAVIWTGGGGQAVITCPAAGIVPVEARQLRRWRIDANRLAEIVSETLGFDRCIEPVLAQQLWRLGRRRLAGRHRDIFLGVAGGPPLTETSLTEMSAAVRRSIGQAPALLLAIGYIGNAKELPTAQDVVDLVSVSRLGGARLIIDVEYLEDRFSAHQAPARKLPPSVSAPVGAGWSDASIMVCDESLRITIGHNTHEIEFSAIGNQAQTVELLKLFAAARGTLDAARLQTIVSGDTPVRLRISRLRQLLQALIDIDGDPVEYSKKARTYTCSFEIRPPRDEGFPTPSGASWLDFSFHERTDGRVLVSVIQKQKFRVHGMRSEDGRPTSEVAEEGVALVRTHSLHDMGLRSDTGKMTAEGAAFTKLLRAGGSVPRNGNDIVVLKLAERLREWTGLNGDPLRLVEASRAWTALFACSSDLRTPDA